VSTKKAASSRTPRRSSPPRKKPPQPAPSAWLDCVRAAEGKKASAIRVLDLRPVSTFADFFVICSGANQRQIQAICDEVTRVMKLRGETPYSLEGYNNAEWILVDYGDLLVHIFSEKARAYYDLDRLWRDAAEMAFPAETA